MFIFLKSLLFLVTLFRDPLFTTSGDLLVDAYRFVMVRILGR